MTESSDKVFKDKNFLQEMKKDVIIASEACYMRGLLHSRKW